MRLEASHVVGVIIVSITVLVVAIVAWSNRDAGVASDDWLDEIRPPEQAGQMPESLPTREPGITLDGGAAGAEGGLEEEAPAAEGEAGVQVNGEPDQ